jgi:hypothetical protein
MLMAANPKPSPESDPTVNANPDACTEAIDPKAPAGSRNSLGAKSDCNGRPATDDSVVEAIDEQGPITTPEKNESRK